MERRLNSILASLKSIKLWQLAAAVVVLFGSAAATFGVYERVSEPATLGLQDNVQIVPVQYGDLIKQVSTSGNLAYPIRHVLRFGSQGTVAEVLVEEGDQVAAGQPLARIDDTTAAALRLNVATARYDLNAAREALDDLRTPNETGLAGARVRVVEERLNLKAAEEALAETEFQHKQALAQAREALADAEVAVIQAREAVFDFPGEFRQAVAGARLLEAQSRLALDEAQEALAAFGTGHPDDLAKALRALTDAELTLEAARESLAVFQPDHVRQMTEVHDRRATAELDLRIALDTLDNFQADYERQLAEAQRTEAIARERLGLDRAALETYEARNPNRLRALRETRDELTAKVDSSQFDLDRLKQRQAGGATGLDSHIWQLENSLEFLNKELSDTVDLLIDVGKLEAEVEVSETLLAQAEAELALLELGPDQLLLAELEAAALLARSDLDQANKDLHSLELGPNPVQRSNLEAAIEVAQTELDQRKLELAKFQDGPNSLLQQQLWSAHEKARTDLAAAEYSLAKLVQQPAPEVVAFYLARVETGANQWPQGPANQEQATTSAANQDQRAAQLNREILAAIQGGAGHRDLALREAALASAQVTLAMARQELATLEAGVDPLERSLKQAEVASAKAGLAEAQEDLAELLAGPLSEEVLLAQAKLDSAEHDLAEAIGLEEDAEIRSPINGFVGSVNVEEGDPANANTIIIEVVDPRVIEVDGVVDEIDVLSIPVGTATDISLDALPGQRLRGTVVRIAPAALNQQGVVSYPIRVEVEAPDGVALKEGLTTVANILLQEERNVLLIPQQSLYGTFDSPLVRLVNGEGTIEETAVELGNSDDFWIEVRAGLNEGDRLAMESADVATTGPGFRSLRGVTGGSNRGTGRPRPR